MVQEYLGSFDVAAETYQRAEVDAHGVQRRQALIQLQKQAWRTTASLRWSANSRGDEDWRIGHASPRPTKIWATIRRRSLARSRQARVAASPDDERYDVGIRQALTPSEPVLAACHTHRHDRWWIASSPVTRKSPRQARSAISSSPPAHEPNRGKRRLVWHDLLSRTGTDMAQLWPASSTIEHAPAYRRDAGNRG